MSASTVQANPLKAFLSLFEKKEKPKPAPVIVTPQTKTPGGKRVLNPFIRGGGVKSAQQAKPKRGGSGRRTMCVRLCDGYYWPMKRGGTNSSLMTDSQRCESQCSSKAQLFVLHSSTDDIEGMKNLAGKPYSSLENAFSYRKTFNPSCRCKPEPWSERARLRHKRYGAVGKERRELAIRAIRMDMRSTIMPDADAVIAVSAKISDGDRFWDPLLPERKPQAAREMADATMSLPTSTLVTAGAIEESSSIEAYATDRDLKQSVISRVVGNKSTGVFQSRPRGGGARVRVLSVGDLPSITQTRLSRSPISPVRSTFSTGSLVRLSPRPAGIQLRSSLQ